MALTQQLDVRQAQGLVMTPQLQQAIKLLQLNNQELSAYVDGEVEQNPFLDKDEGDGSAMAEALPSDNPAREEETAPESWDGDDFARDTFDETSAVTVPASNDDPGDVDYDNQWSSASASDSGGDLANWRERAGGFDDDGLTLDQTLAAGTSLRDHLLNQLTLETADPGHRLIGLHLIEMVDDAGYLSGDLETWPNNWAAHGTRLTRSSPGSSDSTRRASWRAAWPNVWPISCAISTASTRRWRPCSTIWICWPSAT